MLRLLAFACCLAPAYDLRRDGELLKNVPQAEILNPDEEDE